MIVTLATRVIGLLQGVIILPIIIRFAGTATYGAFILLISAMTIFFFLLSRLTWYRYQRFLTSAQSQDERRRLFEPQFTFQTIVIGFTSGLVLIFGVDIDQFLFNGSTHFSPIVFAGLLVANLVYAQVVYYFLFRQRLTYFNVTWTASPYIFIGMLAVAAMTGLTLSLNALLTLQIASSLIVSLPFLPVLLRDIGLPRLHLSWRAFTADMRVGLPLAVQGIVDYSLRFSDRYLILGFLTVTAVGWYQPAYTVATVVLMIPETAAMILTQSVSKMIDGGDRAAAERAVAAALRLVLMVSIPFFAGVLMVGPSLLATLTTPEIAAAGGWAMPLIAMGSLFSGVMRVTGQLIAFVLGRTNTTLTAAMVGAGFNLGFDLVGLPLIRDVTVAAGGMLVGYAAMWFYLMLELRGEWPVRIDFLAILRFAAAAFVMVIALALLGYRPGSVNAVSASMLVFSIALAMLLYFAALSLLRGIRRREFSEILAMMEGR